MDEYYEQVLYEDHKSKIKFIKFVQVVLLIIAATCLFARIIMGVIIPIILLALTLIYSNKRLAEYEYHLCENELRIYKIVCESRRKLIDKLDLNNIKRASKVIEYLKSDDIDTRIKKINRVTRKSVMKLANKIHLDTIYLLEGALEDEQV